MAEQSSAPPGPDGRPGPAAHGAALAGHVHRRPDRHLRRADHVLWLVGLDFWSGLLFGLLLSMPVVLLPAPAFPGAADRGLAARSVARRAAKEDLRARLSGPGTE